MSVIHLSRHEMLQAELGPLGDGSLQPTIGLKALSCCDEAFHKELRNNEKRDLRRSGLHHVPPQSYEDKHTYTTTYITLNNKKV